MIAYNPSGCQTAPVPEIGLCKIDHFIEIAVEAANLNRPLNASILLCPTGGCGRAGTILSALLRWRVGLRTIPRLRVSRSPLLAGTWR